MASADNPKTHVQASLPAPPAGVTTAPVVTPIVKAPLARMSPEAYGKITDRVDAVLVVLVVLFAFLAASFAIRNSDFFQYLATGRLIAHGDYEFGKDPFSFATQGERWVNHSWLFSYFLYLIYNLGEAAGAVLVVLKALAITALACILLVLSHKPGQRWLLPVVCTAVAILAISARVLLQPVVVSYLFLGLTLLILRWPHLRATAAGPRTYRCFWLLAPLFALWVNCDQWFFLGPVTAGLYWLAEYFQDIQTTDKATVRPPGELRTLGYAVLAGCAACLLNPHHVFALTLPPQLVMSPAATAATKDPQLNSLFFSPLESRYWTTYQGLSASGIAYFPLLAAGVVSFALSYKTVRYWRIVLFVAFAVLSLYHARAMPFFAIVAGPITALNFLDLTAAFFGGEVEPDRLRERWMAGRVAAVLAVVALVVCAIPGWIQPLPYSIRHVEWKVLPDESLVRTCNKMADWRRAGEVRPDAHWFNVSPDVANYMAWYCPGALSFVDLRLGLYDNSLADYVDVRSEVFGYNRPNPGAPDQPQQVPPAWPKIFQKQKVDYLIIHSPDTITVGKPMEGLLRNPEWTPLSIDGRTLVFGWNKDRAAQVRNERMRFDLSTAAFGPKAQLAPRKSPERVAQRHEWYSALWEVPPAHQEEVDDAYIYNLYYSSAKVQMQAYVLQRRQVMVNAVALVNGLLGVLPITEPRSPASQFFTRLARPVSPAPLYVALRGVRQSLQVNPDDPQAYLMLGQLYMTLFWETQEADIAKQYPQLAQLRQAQTVWALTKALALNPDLQEAHYLLLQWYQKCRQNNLGNYISGDFGRPFLDVELRHAKELLRLVREKLDAQKSKDSAASEELEKQIKQIEQETQKLDGDVKRQLDQYEIQSANRPTLQRAQTALELGLGDKALEVLRQASDNDLVVSQSGQQLPLGHIMKIKLLLALGEVEEARTYVNEGNRRDLLLPLPEFRVPCYDWFRLLIAAATGDYDEADEALEMMAQFELKNDALRYGWLQHLGIVAAPKMRAVVPGSREVIALGLGHMLLTLAPNGAGVPWQIVSLFKASNASQRLNDIAISLLGLESDFPALRGWVALEAGDISAARKQFRAALAPALLHNRNWALYGAVGPGLAADRSLDQGGDGWTQVLPLRAARLAQLGQFFLDDAAARER